MDNVRRGILAAAAASAGSAILSACGGAQASTDLPLPFPRVADTSAATPELVDFINGFFAAKTRADVAGAMAYFSPQMVTYSDAVLGWDFAGYDSLKAVLQQFMPNWPATAKSYPTRILGDMTSAVIAFTDTAELFGGEIHAIGALDLQGGKIMRWVDYWDSRGWANAFGVQKQAMPSWHDDARSENASLGMRDVCNRYTSALSVADAASAAALFSYDAVYEDAACRVQILGRSAIQRYFQRALTALPNGAGASLRHALGSDAGGGFEWIGAPGSGVAAGITALTLDASGAITRATSLYDAGGFAAVSLQALAALALEP